MQKKPMSSAEEDQYISNLVAQVKAYDPDLVVGVLRSGMVYATYVAQQIKYVKMAGYDPATGNIYMLCDAEFKDFKRIMFIDDNIVTGETFTSVQNRFSDIDFRFGVLFTDAIATPAHIKAQVFAGVDLGYFAYPVPSIKKVYQQGIRFRDESI